jgi:hypothetical protein
MKALDMTALDELLSAYIDDELEPLQKSEIEALIRSDESVALKYRELKALGPVLLKTFDAINEAPLPDAVQRLLEPLPEKPSMVDRLRVWLSFFEFRGSYAYAFSAALMLAVTLPLLMSQLSRAPQMLKDNQWLDGGSELARALSGAASGTGYASADGVVQLRYSFVSSAGLFCRELDNWTVVIATEAVAVADRSGYETASADDTDRVNDYVDRMMDGDILSLTREAEFMTAQKPR